MSRHHFTRDTSPLVFGHGCAAILVDRAGRYLLQRRDDIPRIWFPGHWGFFGGTVEPGETALDATAREVAEETNLVLPVQRFAFFMQMDVTLDALSGIRERHFFTARVQESEIASLRLGEGAEMRWVSGEEALATLTLSPYDGFGLFLHHARARVR